MFRRTLAVLVAAICALTVVTAAPPTGDRCTGTGSEKVTYGNLNAGGFTTPFLLGSMGIVTDDISVTDIPNTNGQITTLSVVIAPGSACGVVTNSANVKLGIYQETSGQYVLLSSTKNIPLSATQTSTAGGYVVTAGLLTTDTPVIVTTSGVYFVGVTSDNSNLCLQGNGNLVDPDDPAFTYVGPSSSAPEGSNLPSPLPGQPNSEFLAAVTVCAAADVTADPVFRGFNGQYFIVKGEAGKVFNLISTPTMTFNNRFVSLQAQNESMTVAEMKAVREQAKASKLKSMVRGVPPVTAAWNHAGTYMGECGITLGESKLFIQPGAYATGFSTVTLDGVAVPVSSIPLELDGDITVTRVSAFAVRVATADVRFTIVNSDNFVNIEHATVLSSADQLTGLLGQTADSEWEVVQSDEFLAHLENDFKLSSDNLFSTVFKGKL